jgi:uncharacterized protein (DUF1697 family)
MTAGVQYLALLRGINVGGKNLVKMPDLRAAFEDLGFAEVATYIQSGNVVFRAPKRKLDDLAEEIESGLSGRLRHEVRCVLLTHAQLRRVMNGAPPGFGADDELSDVIFLRKPLTPKRALAATETREGIDRAWEGQGVVYFSRLAARASGSRLSRVVMRPEYQQMTIRSWSTTTKLLALMDRRAVARRAAR